MTDDIVTRLRESSGMTTTRSDDGFMSIIPDTGLMREAADEIEWLRAEVARLGSFLHPIGTVIDERAVYGNILYDQIVNQENQDK